MHRALDRRNRWCQQSIPTLVRANVHRRRTHPGQGVQNVDDIAVFSAVAILGLGSGDPNDANPTRLDLASPMLRYCVSSRDSKVTRRLVLDFFTRSRG